MRLHPRFVWIAVGIALLVLLNLAFQSSQTSSDPVTDVYEPVYLPVLTRNYPNLFPPPLEARREGWLRKWHESQESNYCLEAGGTPYYLEREPGEVTWLAAVAETDVVPDVEIEVHIDEKVAVTGTAGYFDPACNFPRLNARKIEVIEVLPEGAGDP